MSFDHFLIPDERPSMLKAYWVYVAAFAFAAVRVSLVVGLLSMSPFQVNVFKDAAHFFVSGLFVASWWQVRSEKPGCHQAGDRKFDVAVSLSLVELVCALLSVFLSRHA